MKLITLHRFATATALALSVGVLGVATPNAVHSAAMEQKVDLGHTSVHFMIWHGGFSRVIGQFRSIDVELTFDKDDVSNSKVKAEIDAASLDSNHYFRDNYTRSETFLNVIKNPKITFVSTKVWKTGDNTGKMTGDLTLRGVTKPVTLDITYNKGGKHLSGKYMIEGFTARGTIKRSEFGMDAFIPWVADEVEILIQLEGNHS